MPTTSTTQTQNTSISAQKAALGPFSSMPTTNPTLKAVKQTSPLLSQIQSSNSPKLPKLGDGPSSAMVTTLPAGTGAQNPTPNQNNMCEVCNVAASTSPSSPHSFHRIATRPPSVSTPPP